MELSQNKPSHQNKEAEKPNQPATLMTVALTLGLGLGLASSFYLPRKPPAKPRAPIATPLAGLERAPLNGPSNSGGPPSGGATGTRILFNQVKVTLPPGWNDVSTDPMGKYIASPADNQRLNSGLFIQVIPVKTLTEGWQVVGEWEKGHQILAESKVISETETIQSRWADLVSPPAHLPGLGTLTHLSDEVQPFAQRRLYALVRVPTLSNRIFVIVHFSTETEPDRPINNVLKMADLVALARTLQPK